MAYTIKKAGSDWETIRIRDIKTGEDLPDDQLEWVKFSAISWTKDNKGFFYSRFDAPNSLTKEGFEKRAGQETDRVKNHKVYYHHVGTKQNKDVLMFQIKDQPDLLISNHISNCGQYLLFSVVKGNDGK